MRNLINLKLLLVFSLVTTSNTVLAEKAENSERQNTVSSSSAGPAINQSADTSQKANNSSSSISKVIGVGMMALGAYNAMKGKACAATCGAAGTGCCGAAPMYYGMAAMNFMMGAQSFMQSKNNAGAAYNSGITGMDTSSWNNPFGDPNNPGAGGPGSSTPYIPPSTDLAKDKDVVGNVNLGKFDEVRHELTTTGIGGFKLDPKTGILTGKDGKKYDSNKLTDSKALADAGFSKESIDGAMQAAAGLEKAAMKKLGLNGGPEGIGAATATNGFIEGGAADMGTLSGKAGDAGYDSGGGRGRGVASTGGMGKVASGQVAGLTKNFNGERIGVSAENIFDMMTRRYKTKEKQNSFFDPSERVKMPQ